MKTTHITLLFGALVLFSNCKKTEYSNTSTTTQPVFYFTGSINGSLVNIQAGVNNYYMATSYAKDSTGVYNYTGEFMLTGYSSSYPNCLKIFFRDNLKTPSSNPKHIDTVITPGYYSFSAPAGMASAYSVQFQDFFNQTATSYKWDFGDGQTGNTTKPIHIYSRPDVYHVSVLINSSFCSSTDTNDAVVGQAGNAFIAPFSYNTWYTTAYGDSNMFQAVPNGVSPYTYTWNFGDGKPIKAGNPVNHTFTNPGIYFVSVTCTDNTGYTGKQGFNVATPTASGCAAGFYEGTQTPIANPYNLNDVGVQWYDNTGVLWTSENNKQNMHSMFHVTSISDYKNNAAGQATKIINAKINCELYNSSGDSIPISGNTVFGVAHF